MLRSAFLRNAAGSSKSVAHAGSFTGGWSYPLRGVALRNEAACSLLEFSKSALDLSPGACGIVSSQPMLRSRTNLVRSANRSLTLYGLWVICLVGPAAFLEAQDVHDGSSFERAIIVPGDYEHIDEWEWKYLQSHFADQGMPKHFGSTVVEHNGDTFHKFVFSTPDREKTIYFDVTRFASAIKQSRSSRIPTSDVLKKPSPRYPEEARKHHITGRGVFILHVDRSTGVVTSVTVHKSTGHKILDDAAVNGILQWRFRPGALKDSSFYLPIAFFM